MDPDLLAEYAMMGASGKDTQWVDGPSIDLVIEYGSKKANIHQAYYNDGSTHWAEDVKGLGIIQKIDISGYISVAFFEIHIKAILLDGKEIPLFDIDRAERGGRYETSTEIEKGKKCRLLVKIGK